MALARSSATVSKEAVSIPSVRILDDVVIHYFMEKKVIASVKLSDTEIDSLDGKGDLNPNEESFFGKGKFFAVKLEQDRYILIFRENGGNRYAIGSGISINSLIFQRSDFKYYSKEKVPIGLIRLMDVAGE